MSYVNPVIQKSIDAATQRLTLIEGILGRIGTPQELIAYLSRVIKGQDEAKEALSLAIYDHYSRFHIYMVFVSNVLKIY